MGDPPRSVRCHGVCAGDNREWARRVASLVGGNKSRRAYSSHLGNGGPGLTARIQGAVSARRGVTREQRSRPRRSARCATSRTTSTTLTTSSPSARPATSGYTRTRSSAAGSYATPAIRGWPPVARRSHGPPIVDASILAHTASGDTVLVAGEGDELRVDQGALTRKATRPCSPDAQQAYPPAQSTVSKLPSSKPCHVRP